MAIRDILFPLMSYPNATTNEAIEEGVAIGKHLGAKVTAITVEIDVRRPPGPHTGALTPDDPVLLETVEHATSRSNSERMIAAFEAAAGAANIAHDRTVRRSEAKGVAGIMVQSARLKDLTLVAIKAHDGAQESVVEKLIFESGRPMLIFPEDSTKPLPNAFECISIAWDGSAQAARAVADAMPLLQEAATVRIITASDEGSAAEAASGKALVKHLAEHGVKATFEMPRIDGSSVGKILEAFVDTNKIDLLVMGAFRHSRLRELVLGGATYTILGHPPCRVLMSH